MGKSQWKTSKEEHEPGKEKSDMETPYKEQNKKDQGKSEK